MSYQVHPTSPNVSWIVGSDAWEEEAMPINRTGQKRFMDTINSINQTKETTINTITSTLNSSDPLDFCNFTIIWRPSPQHIRSLSGNHQNLKKLCKNKNGTLELTSEKRILTKGTYITTFFLSKSGNMGSVCVCFTEFLNLPYMANLVDHTILSMYY